MGDSEKDRQQGGSQQGGGQKDRGQQGGDK